jgi:hypothetical protein
MKKKTVIMRDKLMGVSVFDFDETIGCSDNTILATKNTTTIEISTVQWPLVGEWYMNNGWVLDFSDFNQVTNCYPGPLMGKLLNQINKYGNEAVFILTARRPDSATAIHKWLETQGVQLLLKNIVGLGESSGEAKATWIKTNLIDKGFSDIYFVDDAISNVIAVREMFNHYSISGGKSIMVKHIDN